MKNNLIAKHLWKSCKSHCLVPKTAYNRRKDRGCGVVLDDEENDFTEDISLVKEPNDLTFEEE